MPDPDPNAEAEAAAKAAADAEAAKATADKAEADRKAAEDAAKLGDAGKAALDAERKARRDAEKAAKAVQDKLDALEAEKLTDTEKLTKRAEDAEGKVTAAAEKLRRANLITALADKGLTGSKAKAAAKLLDTVEYSDDDEPSNLDDALTAAMAEYGEDVFKATGYKPAAPKIDGPGTKDEPGPDLTPEEAQYASAFGLDPADYQAHKDINPPAPATT